jgi:hypothetical protein
LLTDMQDELKKTHGQVRSKLEMGRVLTLQIVTRKTCFRQVHYFGMVWKEWFIAERLREKGISNGKESNVNRAQGGSTYPG